jgi:hypothetical protein
VPSLRIQVVLYRSDPAEVCRLVESLAHSTALAQAAGLVGTAQLLLGDSAPEALSLSRAEVARLGTAALPVELVEFDDNLGHGGGQNRLAEGLSEDLLLVINPDTVAEPQLVSRLVATMARNGRVAIVEARQLPVEHPKDYDPATGRTDWTSMACALLRARAVEEVGLFDATTFFMHGDDVDLSWRMRLAGWELVHEPAARVFHDKRIGTAGYIEPSSAEAVHGPLAGLLLAYKYDRDDQVEALSELLRSGAPEQQQALELFESKRSAGQLPAERLDSARRVASFEGGTFARHRF